MCAVPGIVVDEVPEVADPAVNAEQVKRGRSYEEDRADVGPEEATNLRDRPQRSAYIRNFSRGVVHDCLLAVSSHSHRRSSMFCVRPGRAGLTRAVHPRRPRIRTSEHPLEPLSADEFKTYRRGPVAMGMSRTFRFASIELMEGQAEREQQLEHEALCVYEQLVTEVPDAG